MTAPLIEKVWSVCEKRELRGRTVTLKVKYADFEQITRSKSRPLPVGSREELKALVHELLSQTFPPRMPVRLLGVTLSSLGNGSEDAVAQMALPIEL